MEERSVGAEALAYIDNCLLRGSTLAHKVRSVDLASGEVITYLPEGADPRAMLRFDEGGIGDQDASRSWVCSLVCRYLNSAAGRCAVFETPWLCTDPCVHDWSALQWFSHAGALFAFVASGCCSTQAVAAALHAARRYPFIAVLSQFSPDMLCRWQGVDFATELLGEMAARTDHILVGAYDEESALLWSRMLPVK
jgi:hypothetical protein